MADAHGSGPCEGYLMRVQVSFPARNGWDEVFILSQLSFKAFCIEKYADYKSIPSNEVYKLFEEKGVIEMLDRDYDILHGFGFEYIVRDIEQFLDGDKI